MTTTRPSSQSPSDGGVEGPTAIALVGSAGPSPAHHSFAMFDQEHPIQLIGTVKEFRYTSPHSFIILEVKDSSGAGRRSERPRPRWLVEQDVKARRRT
jgi:Family of unknown function (DUF6152)